MLIPELKIGDYVKVDCDSFTEIAGTVRTGEISKVNEDSTYDIRIGMFIYPSCEPNKLMAYKFKLEPLIIGVNVALTTALTTDGRVDGKIIEYSHHSLCYDIQLIEVQKIIKNLHYDFFHPIYQTFAINEKVWYSENDLHGTIVEQVDDLWYKIKFEDGNVLKIPEFKLSKRSEYTKSALFRWLKN